MQYTYIYIIDITIFKMRDFTNVFEIILTYTDGQFSHSF